MKLKKWLALSHLIVMLTPILSGIMLFTIINHYNQNTELIDYISVMNKFKMYEVKLENPKLYQGQSLSSKNLISKEDEICVGIELYNPYGQQIYASSNSQMMGFAFSKENLYSDLYKIQTGTKAYTLKKPVFNNDILIGFYKIAIARNDFIQGINYRTIFILSIFILIIGVVFTLVMLLLNKKLNQPIKLLIEGMNRFAGGKESLVEYKTKDEIGEIILHFNSMKKDIEEKRKTIDAEHKSKDYMISAISHDLKTPLTAIRAYAETIMQEDEGNIENIRKRAQVILNKSDYIKTMIDDLMMYNLLSTNYEMNFINLEGSEFFEMLFSGYEESCYQKQIELTLDINVQDKYRVDVNQMTRVVDNLMTNALRHTPEKGHIWMGAFSLIGQFPKWIKQDFADGIKQWKQTGLIILIQNEGNRIEESEKEKIFIPFYQSDNSRNKRTWNGVGLGLSIVRLVIEKHDGEVKVLSEGNRTAFMCWFPN